MAGTQRDPISQHPHSPLCAPAPGHSWCPLPFAPSTPQAGCPCLSPPAPKAVLGHGAQASSPPALPGSRCQGCRAPFVSPSRHEGP